MSRTAISFLFVLVVMPVIPQQELPPIRNFLRVNEDFCTGGQPRPEHLQKLKEDGVKAIINLRPTSEHRAVEEEAKAKELGLRYFNIPVVFTDPKEEQVTEFLKITDDPANRPAFIHCASAIRVGAFWMIRRVLRDHWKVETAEEEAKKIGLKESPHLNEFARQYIEKYQQRTAGIDEAAPYDDAEAYAIYSSLIPSELAHAKSLVIQQETQNYKMCLKPEPESQEKLGPAITQFLELNSRRHLFNRSFAIALPYQLISAGALQALLESTQWQGFYQQYPQSGGWIEMSAVGFNADRTIAVAYIGHHCGWLCGGGQFHVVEKQAGKWVPLEWKGMSCVWNS